MLRKNILSNYLWFSLLILILFVVFRLAILLLYSYPFNLYCSDSITYLRLALNPGQADANRPSGYPAILSLILPLFFNHWYVLSFIQSALSFCLVYLALKILRNKLSIPLIFLWICLVFFNFQTVFMEKSIMSESISYSFLILGSLIIISGLNRWWKYILIGIIAGLLPLLRTNFLIFSLLFICIPIVRMSFSRGNIQKHAAVYVMLLCLPFVFINSMYIHFFVYPKLGVKQMSSFGGRALFSRVMEFTSCNTLKNINVERTFLTTLVTTCGETSQQGYSQIMFSEDGLIYKVNNKLHLDRAKSDALYFDASRQLIFKEPLVIAKIFFESMKDTFTADDSFYQSNRYPIDARCAEYLDKFGIDYQVFTNRNDLNYSNPSILLFAFLAALSQKAIVLVLYVLIPFWLSIKMIQLKPKRFVKEYGESLIIWAVSVLYFTVTLIFTGFDYRYMQPLWLIAAWGIYNTLTKSKS